MLESHCQLHISNMKALPTHRFIRHKCLQMLQLSIWPKKSHKQHQPQVCNSHFSFTRRSHGDFLIQIYKENMFHYFQATTTHSFVVWRGCFLKKRKNEVLHTGGFHNQPSPFPWCAERALPGSCHTSLHLQCMDLTAVHEPWSSSDRSSVQYERTKLEAQALAGHSLWEQPQCQHSSCSRQHQQGPPSPWDPPLETSVQRTEKITPHQQPTWRGRYAWLVPHRKPYFPVVFFDSQYTLLCFSDDIFPRNEQVT